MKDIVSISVEDCKIKALDPLDKGPRVENRSNSNFYNGRLTIFLSQIFCMIFLLSSCGKPVLYPGKRKVRLSEKEVAANLKLAGFPDYMIPTMVCVAKHESKFRVDAKNVNENGSTDHGLFQINDAWWLAQCGVDPEGLKDPLINAKCAKTVFDRQGLMAWYAYQKHWSTCNNYEISHADNAEWEEIYPGPVQPKSKLKKGSLATAVVRNKEKARCNEKKLRSCLVSGKGWSCFNRFGCKSE